MNELDILAAALKIESPADRHAFLAKACGDDTGLRQRLEALIRSAAAADRARETPAPPLDATIESESGGGSATPPRGPGQSSAEEPGATIGPYKLLQELGEGGMGTVYMAEQRHPVRRRVALKIIKHGMDSRQVIARFEAERQALALMDHNNIARVLDAGTTERGRPYFVMELVKGAPITEYCDRNNLSVRERLELFIPVCRAIHHAHQKAIIHRDIKPSNVLVTLYDGHPVPKVIDFGIAKATGSQLTEKTMFTEMGQVVGTLEYMSPEQAELNQLDIDTRSDVYSLGVLLYELLTGSTPVTKEQLREGGILEVLRTIREADPPRPSTRLSESRDALPSISAVRKTEPSRLSKLVRGDLDWVVMKALEKDRQRRYESANGLSDDIERYLSDEPVEASPPSAVYRSRKFVKKHRYAFSMAAVLVVLLVAGAGVSTWQAIRASMAEARALQDEQAARMAEARATRLADDNKRIADANARIANDERQARSVAERKVREATAMRLAAQSEMVRAERPVRSLLLALEAAHTTLDGKILPTAHYALRRSTLTLGGIPVGQGRKIQLARFSPDGRLLVAADQAGLLSVWDLDSDPREADSREVSCEGTAVLDVSVSADRRWLAVGTHVLTIFDLTQEPLQGSVIHRLQDDRPGSKGRGIREIVFSPDSRNLVAVEQGYYQREDGLLGDRDTARIWSVRGDDPAEWTSQIVGSEKTHSIRTRFSQNSQWLVVGCKESPGTNMSDPMSDVFQLWHISEQKALSIDATSSHIHAFTLSPDSRWFITSGADGKIRVWDLTAEDPLATPRILDGQRGGHTRMVISRNSRWLVAARASSKQARVWDLTLPDANKNAVVIPYPGRFGEHGFDLESASLISITDGEARRWPLTLSALRDAKYSSIPGFLPPAFGLSAWRTNRSASWFTSDGRWLVIFNSDKIVQLFSPDAKNAEEPSINLIGHDDMIQDIELSANGRWLVTLDGTGMCRLWDLRRDDPAIDRRVPSGGYNTLSSELEFSGNGRWLVQIKDSAQASLWDMHSFGTSAPRYVRPAGENRTTRSVMSRNHRWLATLMRDRSAYVWDLDAPSPTSVPRHQFHLNAFEHADSVAVGPKGRWVAAIPQRSLQLVDPQQGESETAGEKTPSVYLWDLVAGSDPIRLRVQKQTDDPDRSYSGAMRIAFSHDGRWLIYSGGRVCLWDMRSPDLELNFPERGAVASGYTDRKVVFDPSGRWMTIQAFRQPTKLFDLHVDDPGDSAREVGDVSPLAFSHDGRWMAAARGESVVLVDVQTAGLDTVHALATENKREVVFSPDNRWLVTIGKGTELWDLTAEDPADSSTALPPTRNEIQAASISPDGIWLATTHGDGTARRWCLDLSRLLYEADWKAGRELTVQERKQYALEDGSSGWNTEAWRGSEGSLVLRPEVTEVIDDVRSDLLQAESWQRRAAEFRQMGDRSAAQRELARARDLLAEVLDRRPDHSGCAGQLAAVILRLHDEQWIALSPEEMASKNGATLTLEPDRSILASGVNPERDEYRIIAPVNLPRLSAVRLETIPDSRLPHGGSGRSPQYGAFHLAEILIELIADTSSEKATIIEIDAALADFAQPATPIAAAFDSDERTHWEVYPAQNQPHTAIFQLQTPIDVSDAGASLRITMDSGISYVKQHALGRFRLSITQAPNALLVENLREASRQHKLDPFTLLAAADYVEGNDARVIDRLADVVDRPDQPQPTELLLLALACRRADQPQRAGRAFDLAMEWLDENQADRLASHLAQEALVTFRGLSTEAAEAVLADRDELRELAVLNAAIEADDNNLNAYRARALLRARRRMWRPFALDRLVVLQTDPQNRLQWLPAAAAFVLAGDLEGYSDLCDHMLVQFEDTNDPIKAEVVCKIGALLPDIVDIDRLPVKTVDDALQSGRFGGLSQWAHASRALVAYRAGQYEQAAQWGRKAAEVNGSSQCQALAFAILSMAQFQQDDKDSAQNSLARAAELIPGELQDLRAEQDATRRSLRAESVAHDWLIAEILRREATALIGQEPIRKPVR